MKNLMGMGQSILGSFVNTMDPNNSNPSSVTARLIMAGVAPSDAIVKGSEISSQMRQVEAQTALMHAQQQKAMYEANKYQRQQQIGQGLMSLLQDPNVTQQDIAQYYVQSGLPDEIPANLLKAYENDIKDIENHTTGDYYRTKNGKVLGLAPVSGGGNYGANGGAGGTSGNAAFTDTVQDNVSPPNVMNRGLGTTYSEGSGSPEGSAVQAGVEPTPSNLPKQNKPNYRMTTSDIQEEKKKERETRGLRNYAEFIQKKPTASRAEKLISLIENGIENPEKYLDIQQQELNSTEQKSLADLVTAANDATALEIDLEDLEKSLAEQKQKSSWFLQPGSPIARQIGEKGSWSNWMPGIATTIAYVLDKEGLAATETANKTQGIVAERMIQRNPNAGNVEAQQAIRKTIPNPKQFPETQKSALESKHRFNYQRQLNLAVVNKLMEKGYPYNVAAELFNRVINDKELLKNGKPNPIAKKYFDDYVEGLPDYETFRQQ